MNYSPGNTKNGLDEDVCDSWEQLDSQSLEIQANKLDKKQNETTKKETIGNMANSNVLYAQRQDITQNQPIKILKRPTNGNNTTAQVNTTQAPSAAQPMKTFEQREAEYAQARLRILGSLPSISNNDDSTQTTTTTTTTSIKQPTITNLIREPTQPDGTRGFKQNP